ncbi:HAD-IIIC family phosphatase [Caulobacter sp. S45]|uniref:HAD-IIIC family phosphatase n=1 Tax=Caulobacter sp. S45 TaxID=1641861 RepID=UPI0015765833|nr:HAD-IIIC family phosphatase [Caulobacter sp. S45]
MKETVAGEYATSAALEPSRIADRLDGRTLAGRSQIVWGEHCSECAYPVCYASCSFYDPRPDLNCRRFVAGIEDAGDSLMRIRFRKWGKLEGQGTARLRPYALADRRESRDASLARGLAAAPIPFQLKRSATWRLNRNKARAPHGRAELAVDAFVLEGWSNDGRIHAFTVTFLQEARGTDGGAASEGGTWQAHLQLGPDYGRHVLPAGAIAAAIRLDQPFLVQVEPVGEAEGIDVTLALADFVAFHDRADAVVGPSALGVGSGNGQAPALAKVLVWDLDETFWTGTLAEDGSEGVTPRPEAVTALKALDARGVLHSIASKNDANEALTALRRFGLDGYFLHPQVGWGPKSASVATIAAALDLGLDSFVFVDDQPFERAEVAAAHPRVRTLAHTEVAALTQHPWFDHPETPEAARRRSLYQAEAARGLAVQASGSDYLAFLRASRLTLDVRALEAADLTRVYELSQRTNQLNFTGAKFTRPEVEALVAPDPHCARLTLRCADAWGDYGLIGFADLDLAAGELVAFFMSCRVQRKRVEHAAFAYMAGLLAARGHSEFAVRFDATERNGAAVRLLEDLGFARIAEGWRRPLGRPFAESDIVRLDVLQHARAA